MADTLISHGRLLIMRLFTRLANAVIARVAKLALEALQTGKRIVGQPPSREINTSGRIFGRRGIMSVGRATHRNLLRQTGHRPGPKANRPMHRGLS